jgi:hypothetical protein
MYRFIFYLLVFYIVYKGILYVMRLFTALNKKASNGSTTPKSRFKDIEEANYTEIKEDKDKDSH